VRGQEAARLAVRVDEEAIEREVSDVDPKELQEELRRSGLTMARVREDVHDSLLDVAIFKTVVAAKEPGESPTQAMKRWQDRVDGLIAAADYAPDWRPAERARSPIPPELKDMPKAKGPCDLKKGTFTLREVWAHGCAEHFGIPLPGVDGQACREVPIDDFVVAGLSQDEGYAAYEEDLMDTAPSCVPYPGTKWTVMPHARPALCPGPGSGIDCSSLDSTVLIEDYSPSRQ